MVLPHISSTQRRLRIQVHRNAKTTPNMRALLVHRVCQEQWSPAEPAAAAGISVRTTRKWLRRHRLGGRPALEDASSRPHHTPHATPAADITRIVELRLGRPPSTVSAILAPTRYPLLPQNGGNRRSGDAMSEILERRGSANSPTWGFSRAMRPTQPACPSSPAATILFRAVSRRGIKTSTVLRSARSAARESE